MTENTNLTIASQSAVVGNISDCKIENKEVAVERPSAFWPTKTVTYMTYNTCGGNEVSRYQVKELGGGFILTAVIIFMVLVVAAVNN